MIPRSILEYALIVCLIALLVVGCEDPNVGKSSKRIAQENLLHELDTCDSKFGTDSSERRQMNQDYCKDVLDRVDILIKEGYFEDDNITQRIIEKTQYNDTPSRTEEQQTVQDELDSTVNEIIGDV